MTTKAFPFLASVACYLFCLDSAHIGSETLSSPASGTAGTDLMISGDAETQLSSLYEICETYSTCNTSADVPAHVKPYLECCLPCDCSDDCFIVGNCCKDKAGNPQRTAEGEIVSKQGEVCSTVYPINKDDKTFSYLLVAQCHPAYSGEARQKCLNKTSRTLLDTVPVYSKQTGLSYRNIYCAYCNNQTNELGQWEISVISERQVVFRDLGNQEFVLPEYGTKVLMSPNIFPNTRCYRSTSPDMCRNARYRALCSSKTKGYSFVQDLRHRACITCGWQGAGVCGFEQKEFRSFFTNLLREITDVLYAGLVSGTPVGSAAIRTRCPEGLTFSESAVSIERGSGA